MANDSDRKKDRVDRKTFRGFGPDAQKFAGDDESLAEKVAAKGFDRDNEGRKKRKKGAALAAAAAVAGAASPSEVAPADPAAQVSRSVRGSFGSPGQRGGPPAIDIDLVYERRTAPLRDQRWTFLEIWTRNTIYALDSNFCCIDVIDQGTRRSHPTHPLLGARLVGGQSRDGEAVELSHPFPRPGSEAVFEQAKGRQVRFSQTSSVTRVVLRLRVLTVANDHLLPTWEEITGTHEIPKS